MIKEIKGSQNQGPQGTQGPRDPQGFCIATKTQTDFWSTTGIA